MREAIGDGVDAMVNFAAETHVDRSILDPGAFLRTDMLGTHVLLEALREFAIPRYLQVSTDEVYGDVADGRVARKRSAAAAQPVRRQQSRRPICWRWHIAPRTGRPS